MHDGVHAGNGHADDGRGAGEHEPAFGGAPDAPDDRDWRFEAPKSPAPPPRLSLRGEFPPVYTQGQLSSCAGQAVAAALQFDRRKQNLPSVQLTPSRLFIYYNARVIEGDPAADKGCQIRSAIKGVARFGACFEGEGQDCWPYVIDKFKEQPPAPCFTVAREHRAVQYHRIDPKVEQMKGCLASGYPFVFGFMAFSSLKSDEVKRSGAVPLPKPGDAKIGHHVVLAVGYDDDKRCIEFRNSWGPAWGNQGYGTIPYEYLQRTLAPDFWTIRHVANA